MCWSPAATAAKGPARHWPPTVKSAACFLAAERREPREPMTTRERTIMTDHTLNRRRLLGGAAALAALPLRALAQGAPIKIGTLTPLTGAGGPYGPVMVKAVRAV